MWGRRLCNNVLSIFVVHCRQRLSILHWWKALFLAAFGAFSHCSYFSHYSNKGYFIKWSMSIALVDNFSIDYLHKVLVACHELHFLLTFSRGQNLIVPFISLVRDMALAWGYHMKKHSDISLKNCIYVCFCEGGQDVWPCWIITLIAQIVVKWNSSLLKL